MKYNDLVEDQTRTIEPISKWKHGSKPVGRGVETNEFEAAIEQVRSGAPMAWKKYYEDGVGIWRGQSGYRYKEILYKGNSGSGRKSAYTSNHFTLILEFIPSWEHVPTRSKSWICSTGKHTATGFGKPFQMFPIDDVEIAFCRSADFWDAFGWTLENDYKIRNLSEFNSIFKRLFTDSSMEEMIAQIELFDELGIQKYMNNDPDLEIHRLNLGDRITDGSRNATITFFDTMVQQHGSVMKGLNHLFDPTLNGITIHNFSELNVNGIEDDVECWFEGPTYLMDIDYENRREVRIHTKKDTDEYLNRLDKTEKQVRIESVDDSGTFIGIKLSDRSENQLEQWCHQHDLNCEDFHITLVFDKNQFPYDPTDVSITLFSETYELDVFDGVLVLRFKNDSISKKHMILRNRYDISWDYDEYKPHITLDSDWNKPKPDFDVPNFDIELSHEYKEGFDK